MGNAYLRSYLDVLLSLGQAFDLEAVSRMIEQLEKARAEHRRIFVFGNGGSASHANHYLISDLILRTAENWRERVLIFLFALGFPDIKPSLINFHKRIGNLFHSLWLSFYMCDAKNLC